MKQIHIRQSTGKTLVFWLIALALLGGAAGSYYKQFYLPYKNVSFKGCPSSCSYNSDCAVPGCSSKLRCVKGKCQFPNEHTSFFNFTVIALLTFFGLAWGFATFVKQSNELKVNEHGIFYKSLFKSVDMPWDKFLGLTYHGVNTRLGSDATVYSLTGDTGLFSFMVPGLPEGTTTRDLPLGAFFWLSLTVEECQQLLVIVKEFGEQEPEPEHEW